MSKSETQLIRQAMEQCEGCPMGGVGKDGPAQAELDAAIADGHPIENEDAYHRFQQIWILLNRIKGNP